jgi:hypothetical protein
MHGLRCNVREAVPIGADNPWRPFQLRPQVGRQELLDHLPPELRIERAFRNLLSSVEQGKHVARLVESERQAGKSLVAHKLQKVRFRKPFRVMRVEAVPSVFDRIGTIQRYPLTRPQKHAG